MSVDKKNIQDSQESSLQEKVQALQKMIARHFPKLWPAVDLGLSTGATLFLQDNVNPVAVIYVGPPSAGKSTVAEMFADAEVNGKKFCYVSDDFTPAAFVSQAANREKDSLKEIDLLPRIRHKVLITPEMATTFRGKEDDLTNTFKVLTRVLDGQGYKRDSGTHGERGYRGDYLFAWLGCTTPFEKKVWKVMAQLGSRLFFLLLDHTQAVTLEDLINPLNKIPYATRHEECKKAVHGVLSSLFCEYEKVRGVQWEKDKDDKEILTWIAQCAMLLAKMRSEPGREKETSTGEFMYLPGADEVPYRAYAVLYNLARGHALVHGRRVLGWEDLPLIAKVTVSTMPTQYGEVFTALVKKQGEHLKTPEVQRILNVIHPKTARGVMKDLAQQGVIELVQPGKGETSSLRFTDEWSWCGSPTFHLLLSDDPDLSKIGGCEEAA